MKGILERVLKGSSTLIVSIVLFLLLWGGVLLSFFGEPVIPVPISPFGFAFTLGPLVQASVSMLLFLVDAYLLYLTVNEFSFYNIRTNFAQSLFLVLMGGSWFLIPLHSGNICLTIALLVIYLLLSTYQQRFATMEYVTSYALLSILTILSPKWMLIIPMFIIGCGLIQSLTLRTFMAAIIGLILPYWVAGGLLFLFDETERFIIPFLQLAEFCPIRYEELSFHQIMALLLLLFLAVPSMFHYPISSFNVKEKARVCYNFFFVLFVSTLALILLQPCLVNEFFALLAAVTSIFVTQMFVSSRGRFRNVYFVLMLIFYLLFILEPLWVDLLIS